MKIYLEVKSRTTISWMVSNRKDRPLFGSRDLLTINNSSRPHLIQMVVTLTFRATPFSGFFQTLQGTIVRDVVSELCRSAPKSLWIGRSKVGVTEKAPLDVQERSSFRPEKTRVFGVFFLGGSGGGDVGCRYRSQRGAPIWEIPEKKTYVGGFYGL